MKLQGGTRLLIEIDRSNRYCIAGFACFFELLVEPIMRNARLYLVKKIPADPRKSL